MRKAMEMAARPRNKDNQAKNQYFNAVRRINRVRKPQSIAIKKTPAHWIVLPVILMLNSIIKTARGVYQFRNRAIKSSSISALRKGEENSRLTRPVCG